MAYKLFLSRADNTPYPTVFSAFLHAIEKIDKIDKNGNLYCVLRL